MKLPITSMAVLLSLAPLTAMSQTDPVTGKEIFEQMCAGCHGTRGDGGAGQKSGFVPRVPTLANKEYMNSVPDDYLVLIIQKGGEYMGKMSSMPAWEKRLSEQQIRDVVAHIRTF